MTLQNIETAILALIGEDKYSDFSTDANRTADFANLHTCVNLARDEIKLNASMPALVTVGTVIPSVVNQSAYSLPTNFDVPVKMFYMDTDGVISELTQLYVQNIADVVLGMTTGTPSSYIILGTSGNLIQVYLVSIPALAGESLLPIYKPVLTALSLSTDEDIILRKYPKAVINFATAFAWQILKKDQTQYDKFYAYGLNDCRKIDLREISADPNTPLTPDAFLSNKRQNRFTR